MSLLGSGSYCLGAEAVMLLAHRCVLISASPVFHHQFTNCDFKPESEVEIKDISPDAFKQLLRLVGDVVEQVGWY